MAKKIISAALGMIMLLSVCACYAHVPSSVPSAQSQPSGQSQPVECPYFLAETMVLTTHRAAPYGSDEDSENYNQNIAWIPPVDNETPLDEAYGGLEVAGRDAWVNHMIVCDAGYPYEAYRGYLPKLSFVRQTDGMHFYAVYNVQAGGRLFIFYGLSQVMKDTPCLKSYLTLYVTKSLSYSDFESIRITDGIDKVIEVDPGAQKLKNNSSLYIFSRNTTYHLLTDGMLVINYIEKNGRLMVSDMSYNPDFSMYSESHEEYFDSFQAKCYGVELAAKILPQDYPAGLPQGMAEVYEPEDTAVVDFYPFGLECPEFDSYDHYRFILERQFRYEPKNRYIYMEGVDKEAAEDKYITDIILWEPPQDNVISVDEAYGDLTVRAPVAWTSGHNNGGNHFSLNKIHSVFDPPLTFIRKVDECHYYIVYNAECGGRIYYFFTIYDKNPYDEIKNREINGYFSLYVPKSMSLSDFGGIRVGDSIDRVIETDPSTEYLKLNDGIGSYVDYSYHLLTDGLLVIKYKTQNRRLYVESMNFHSDFTLDMGEYYINQPDIAKGMDPIFAISYYRVLQVKILPQDYPE